jgi:hypothetical protein
VAAQRTLGAFMRPALLLATRVTLLAGPTALAFASGGYFTGARLVALVAAFAVLAAALVAAGPGGLRRSHAAWAAIGGLALLAGWTAVSAAWAPVEAAAVDARPRALLYAAAAWAAALAFRPRSAALWVEPALAAGVLVVVGYGLLGETGLLDLQESAAAGGRLYQPLTYWNAEGALAALGLVLAARLAGTRTRPLALRLAAAGAAPLLGLAVYLTFSRGALTALGVGLAVLLAMTPTWSQLRAAAIALEGAALAAIAVEALPDDVAALPVLAVAVLAAAAQAWSAQAEEDDTTATGPLPATGRVRALAWTAGALLALAPFAVAIADRDAPPADPAFGATAGRLADPGSYRYAYWDAALETFAADPAVGAGAGGFAAEWLQRRDITEVVRDAHSLELETAAELGLVGLLLLLVAFGGVVAAIRAAAARDPSLAAGPAAALAVWAAHSAVDWDWELPAVTLVAAVLAGVVLAQGAAQLGEQRRLATQRDHGEEPEEDGELHQRLPQGPVAAPQRQPHR